jgi:hypothetical protein
MSTTAKIVAEQLKKHGNKLTAEGNIAIRDALRRQQPFVITVNPAQRLTAD